MGTNDDIGLHFHKSFNSLLDNFRNAIASLTWLQVSIGDAQNYFAPYRYIIELASSVTDQLIKVDKSILAQVQSEGITAAGTPQYTQTLIDYYRVFTIAVQEIIWNEPDFKALLVKDELQFLRHMRNASAHNNLFYWGKEKQRDKTLQKLPVKWRNKTIENNLEGTRVYMDFFKPGDIFFLLSDISKLVPTTP